MHAVLCSNVSWEGASRRESDSGGAARRGSARLGAAIRSGQARPRESARVGDSAQRGTLTLGCALHLSLPVSRTLAAPLQCGTMADEGDRKFSNTQLETQVPVPGPQGTDANCGTAALGTAAALVDEERMNASCASAEEPVEEVLSPEAHRQACEEAAALKVQGNDLFSQADYDGSIDRYTKALAIAPKDDAKRAIYYANRAAAYTALSQWESVIADCDAAIVIDANYVKAFMRRAAAREQLDQLQGALDDYNKIVELGAATPEVMRKTRELPPRIAEQTEKMKAEMLGKLKDLGNTILGKFGMSLDNFQFVQDPNTGGYSVNMKQ